MAQQIEDFLLCLQNLHENIYRSQEQACIPIFRSLPQNLRTVIQRMVFSDEGKLIENIMQAQVYPHPVNSILDIALKLKLIKHFNEEKEKEKYYQLEPNFRISLRDVIEGKSQSILRKIGDSTEDEAILKQDCCKRWKNLFDLISKRDKTVIGKYRPRVQQTLNDSRLLERNSGAGFSFILSTTHKQINQILKYYVSKQQADVIRFVLCLSVLNPTAIYEMPRDEWQREIIQDLSEFGFTQRIGSSVRITYLLWNFLYEAPAVSIGIQCGIIVEANFRVYAYLNSGDPQEEEILCNLLSLFSEIKKRFSTLIIADLTENSIRKACTQNLEAKQIIQFLEMNNKQLKQQQNVEKQRTNNSDLKKRLDFLRVFQEGLQEKAIIPHNVVQQIQYWENQYKTNNLMML